MGAVQVFAKALGITEAQLFKQMESGSVLAADTLPKVAAAYREAALAGGAYALALKGLRVTEGQMVKSTQEAGDKIFQSGFSEGLSKLYGTIADILKDSGPQLEKLGKLFGVVFKGLAHSLRLIEPLMKVFIDNFEVMFGLGAIKAMSAFATAANLSLARAFLPITVALAATEELISLMSDDLVGVTESAMGKQFNIRTGEFTGLKKKDDKYYSTGAAGAVEGVDERKYNMIKRLGASKFLDVFPNSTPEMRAKSGVQPYSGTVNLTINGVTDDKVIEKIDKHVGHLLQGGMAPNGA